MHPERHSGTNEMNEETFIAPPFSRSSKRIYKAASHQHNFDTLLKCDKDNDEGNDDFVSMPKMHRKESTPQQHHHHHHGHHHHRRHNRSGGSKTRSSLGNITWDRNISNAQYERNSVAHEDMLEEMEKAKQYSAIKNLERASLWLRPLAFLCGLMNKLCCTYRLQFEFHGKLASFMRDPTKQIRKNMSGLFLGVLLGFMAYVFFVITFSHNPRLSMLLSAYVMLVTVFGMAFSSDFRCVALLTLPYLAASRVRWLLMLYASTVSITGPGLNFLHNSGNFCNAIACILAQVSTNMMLLQKLTAAPFSLLRNQLENLISNLNQMLEKMRISLTTINFSLSKLMSVMQQQTTWIRALVDACDDQATLRNQCLSFFNNIYFNCLSSTSVVFCGFIRQFATDTCTGQTIMYESCRNQVEHVNDHFPIYDDDNVTRKFNEILDLVGRQNLTLQGDFDTFDKLTIESDDTVVSILQKRMDKFVRMVEHGRFILSWILVIWTLLTMIQLVMQAAVFRRAWVSKDTFDNVYITPAFVEQEKRALQQGLVPTIPLIRGENQEYKKFSSMLWTNSEKKKAFRSFVVLFLWMLTLCVVLFTDYAMYEVLVTVTPVFSKDFSSYGSGANLGKEYEPDVTSHVTKPDVKGDSSYANVVRSLIGMLNPIKDVALDIDAAACRPLANPPDFRTNVTVITMMGLTIFSIFFEVYILRLRHIIMIWYYPVRGVQRAAWLRTHIRNNRGVFHRLIHKFRTVDVRPGRKSGKISTLGKWLIRFPLLRSLLELIGIKRIMCAFCGTEGNPAKKTVFSENFTQCVECGAYFCKTCQVDLDNICMICRTPLFALAVEVDFEQLSSEEEFEAVCARYLRRANQTTLRSSVNTGSIKGVM